MLVHILATAHDRKALKANNIALWVSDFNSLLWKLTPKLKLLAQRDGYTGT